MTCTCAIKYVKINQCLQLALVVDRDVDYVSNDVGSSPTCTFYLLFSSVFFFLLFTT